MELSNFLDQIAVANRKPALAGLYDKRQETYRQMLSTVARRFTLLFVVLTWYEEIWELALEILDLAGEAMHVVMEFFEEYTEVFLEHILHTNHHQSEIIIVNAVLIMLLIGMYRLFMAAPRLYRQALRNCHAVWLRYKRRKTFYWHSLPQTQKITLVAAYTSCISLLLYWLTL